MYQRPSRKRPKTELPQLNLIPILDSVFIFIFFLLMSSNAISIFEISSDIPIVSTKQPPKQKKKPLALTLEIRSKSLRLLSGIPSRPLKNFENIENGRTYDLVSLRSYLIGLKKKFIDEKTIVIEPLADVTYEEIIKIMDSVRMFKNTDEGIYKKDSAGQDIKINDLFSDIIFGNIQS